MTPARSARQPVAMTSLKPTAPLHTVLTTVAQNLKFHPSNAIVVIAMDNRSMTVRCIWRIDLWTSGGANEANGDWRDVWLADLQHACEQTLTSPARAIVLRYPDTDHPDVSTPETSVNAHLWRIAQDTVDAYVDHLETHIVSDKDLAVVREKLGPMVAGDREELERELAARNDAYRAEQIEIPVITPANTDAVIHQIRQILLAEGPIRPHDLALVSAGLSHIAMRDTVIHDLLASNPLCWSIASERLAEITRLTWPQARVATATVLAILRWQSGDDVRAGIAINVALQHDCQYALAALIWQVLRCGLNRHMWRRDLLAIDRHTFRYGSRP